MMKIQTAQLIGKSDNCLHSPGTATSVNNNSNMVDIFELPGRSRASTLSKKEIETFR